MAHPEKLSLAAARRIAIAAQGLDRPRPAVPAPRHVRDTLARLGVLQIDSVNVLQRAHYLPLFARLGPYDTALLDGQAYRGRRRRFFEYWGHEASLLPCEFYPFMRWRMEAASRGERVYSGLVAFARSRRKLIDGVRDEIAARGPLSAAEIETGGARGEGGWWGWSDAKRALEWLFWCGEITTAVRRGAGFERVYDLTARVLPQAALDAPVPPRDAAQRELLLRAAAASGVATAGDLADYFRLPPVEAKHRLAELVEAGALLPALVEGWRNPAYLHPDARRARRVDARALLAPFDPLVWERARAERLFGFRYRIEIYTPAHRRVHGYYVLPFLLADRLVARVDLKADRQGRVLRVQGVHGEAHADTDATAEAMAIELRAMAAWLGLDGIDVVGRGDLAAPLAAALRARSRRRA